MLMIATPLSSTQSSGLSLLYSTFQRFLGQSLVLQRWLLTGSYVRPSDAATIVSAKSKTSAPISRGTKYNNVSTVHSLTHFPTVTIQVQAFTSLNSLNEAFYSYKLETFLKVVAKHTILMRQVNVVVFVLFYLIQ